MSPEVASENRRYQPEISLEAGETPTSALDEVVHVGDAVLALEDPGAL
jgi:hypothetical protein